jgi:hypothetical protein
MTSLPLDPLGVDEGTKEDVSRWLALVQLIVRVLIIIWSHLPFTNR